jgi:hypothetical protein
MNPKLSILIPSIPSRFEKMQNLYNRLLIECENLPIEIVCLIDNKKRSIGEKRDALVQLAKGDYLTILDDDDDFFKGYAKEIIAAINFDVDVVTFKQKCSLDDGGFYVDFDLFHKVNEVAKKEINFGYIDIKRLPFHCCVWRTSIAQSERFANVGYGEDWDWCKRLIPKCKTQHKINKILHHYIFNSQTTEAPTESNDVWVNPNK